MSTWLEKRVDRLQQSMNRLGSLMDFPDERKSEPETKWLLRKESSICLRRALALWWDLRWGRG